VKPTEGLSAACLGQTARDEPVRRGGDRRTAAARDARARRGGASENRGREDPAQRLSQQILGRLKALGMSERQASLQAGLSPDCVKEIVAGRRRPRPDTLNRLRRVLGCELDI